MLPLISVNIILFWRNMARGKRTAEALKTLDKGDSVQEIASVGQSTACVI
jgi:hypothetical protein